MLKNRFFKFLFFILAAFILLFLVVLTYRIFAPFLQSNEVEIDSNNKPQEVSNVGLANVSNKKFESDKKLQAEADALLSLFDNMPSVKIYLKDEPIVKGGTNVENGVAYNVCENRNSPTIFVKKIFYRTANRKQLVNILKHELTHAWFCRQGIVAEHDARFREKFKQVGGFGN